MRGTTSLAAAGAALALASGCGGSDGDGRSGRGSEGGSQSGSERRSDTERVTATVKTYFAALADGDAKKACAQFTRVARARPAGGGCERVVTTGTPAIPDENKAILRDIPISDVSVDRAGARVTVSAPTGSQTVSLEREGGRWKIAAIGGG